MKFFDKVKTIQLIIFVILTIALLIFIFTDQEAYHLLAVNSHLKVVGYLGWLILGLSFVFLYFDFNSYSNLKREYSEMDLAIFSDPVTGMANRGSCDAYIEKYLDKPLPEDIGCITFDITNLKEINEAFGHKAGNNEIRSFSAILQSSAINVCFVGRNGGNKFLAIFNECSDKKMEDFLANVDMKMKRHNENSKKSQIKYAYGKAFNEGDAVKNINELIALSNRRAIETYRTFSEK